MVDACNTIVIMILSEPAPQQQTVVYIGSILKGKRLQSKPTTMSSSIKT